MQFLVILNLSSPSMDFNIDQFVFEDTVIHFLEYDNFDPVDYLEHLTSDELERYHSFNHIKRQREFVATRILRHQVFGYAHIHYNSVGAPYINGEGYISISHAANFVAIAFNRKFPLGLDVELIRDKALRLRSKFLTEEETSALEIDNPVEMTMCWSAKEALYKLAGRKKIDFRKDLHLAKGMGFSWKGKIMNPGQILFVDLHIFEYKNYIITFNSSSVVTA